MALGSEGELEEKFPKNWPDSSSVSDRTIELKEKNI